MRLYSASWEPPFIKMRTLITLKCVQIILPEFQIQYIHNQRDVINGMDKNDNLIGQNGIRKISVEISKVLAVHKLRFLSEERRKCVYYNESKLDYFRHYTRNLCFIECRIKVVIGEFGCVPFFYNVGKFNIFFFNSRTIN